MLTSAFTYRNDQLENQIISEFRWVRIKRKSGSILLDNQHQDKDGYILDEDGTTIGQTGPLKIPKDAVG